MTRVLCVAALAAAMLGLAGCDDYVTPAGVVRTAAQKLREKKLGGFRSALRGAALERFGTKEGMAELSAKLNAYPVLATGKAHRFSLKSVQDNGFQTATALYDVDVLAKDAPDAKDSRQVMTATVQCDIFQIQESPRPAFPQGGGYDCRTIPGPCNVPSLNTTEVTQCWVIDLK